ncbi:hypothetical protein GCK72_011840 [Caenorhabditis remanei]|uniref:Uncharacterized protein n=1 Tax=Caenorhabditis remanei TaxID=31234 RepID=A0A6A5H9S6_CAERE|nr:hypothetical protein GCK72_011840 [Caenorhabditis remanei]KAF1763574.1 hypothetical protein GCK72_011840 [Caenorhabditis remanei]
MNVVDTLHCCLHISHRRGRRDTIIDISNVDTVSLLSVVGLGGECAGASSVGDECGVVGGLGGAELQWVDVFSHLDVRIVWVGHVGVAELGDWHEFINCIRSPLNSLWKWTLWHWISILSGVQNTNDSISCLCLNIWNSIHIFRTLASRLLTSRFWPHSATLLGVLTSRLSRVLLEVTVALDRDEVGETSARASGTEHSLKVQGKRVGRSMTYSKTIGVEATEIADSSRTGDSLTLVPNIASSALSVDEELALEMFVVCLCRFVQMS